MEELRPRIASAQPLDAASTVAKRWNTRIGASKLNTVTAEPKLQAPAHVQGGSLAVILVARSATRWLRLKAWRRTSEQSLRRMYLSNS